MLEICLIICSSRREAYEAIHLLVVWCRDGSFGWEEHHSNLALLDLVFGYFLDVLPLFHLSVWMPLDTSGKPTIDGTGPISLSGVMEID